LVLAVSVALHGPDMLSGLQQYLIDNFGRSEAPRIEAARRGEESGLYGAAVAAGALAV